MSSHPSDESTGQSQSGASVDGTSADAAPSVSPPGADQSQQAARAEPIHASLTFPVVGIGASAGGLEALEALTQGLSAEEMAFVVVQHLAPGHASMLSGILGRGTALRVVTIEHEMRIEPGVIYVAPPSVELSMRGDELRLSPASDGRGVRHGIDAFLRSLAQAGGPMSIGVLLSGSGSDGTVGLKAIKEEGGVTFVQEPSSAAQPSMPQSALDAGCADFSLTPAEIGDELMRLGRHPYVGRRGALGLVDRDATAKIFAQLRAAFGVDFALYKQSTIERRIGRRMALHKVDKIDNYLSFLRFNPAELQGLYNDLLIGVTSFFRDAEAFDTLQNVVFPRLFDKRPAETPIRIWVAGCATGEEAYSMAIALLEFLGDRAGGRKIQIFATDVDEDALARARAAVYPQNIEADVSSERLRRFFPRTEKGFQVARQVRDLVVFARHDLGKDPPFSRLDLISCRNVLIYMQAALQRTVLRIFHYALNPDAYVLLGTSESVGDAADLFSLLDRKLKLYGKKNIPATAVFEVSFAGRRRHGEAGAPGHAEHRPVANLSQLADRKVIEKYGPPGVIVDEKLEVVQFRGRIGPYLEPAPGIATLNLLKLARPELLVALRTTIHKGLTEGVPAASPPVPLWSPDGPRAVSLDVMPLPDSGGRRSLLVLFTELTSRPPVAGQTSDDGPGAAHVDPRVLELERELAANKEYLQSTIEELEAANEELQSSNEELQSSNEELQSTNEELETSKEELQSTNEELATLNDELHNRMSQLSVANDDLQNVLLNSTPAIVIVSADLRIRRFSAAAEKLLNLIPADVGRPIAYLRNVMSARDIEQIASDAISSVASREQRVRCIDGFWYLMKMSPYVTADHMIRGLVTEFTRTTPPSAPAEGEHLPPIAQQVLSTLPQPLMLIDRRMHLVWANRAFFEQFGVEPGALGRPVTEAWDNWSDSTSEVWAFLEELVSGKPPRDLVVEHPFGRRAERPMRFSGRPVPTEGDRPTLAMVFMHEA